MMKISEALKKERVKRNLLQKDMIRGLKISKSHYSLIEKGVHRIYADDLMKMLANNKIDYSSFFDEIANDYGYEDDVKKLTHELDFAFYKRDLKKTREIKKKIAESDTPIELKYHADLVEAELANSKVATKICKKINEEIFCVDNWTQSRDALRLFGNSMKYLDSDIRDILMESVLQRYQKIQSFEKEEQIRIIEISLNYLFNYDKRVQNNNTKLIFEMIKALPPIPDLTSYKLVGTYFKARFDGDFDKMHTIKNALKFSGYENMSEKMDQFPVGNLDNKREVMIKMKFRRQ